MESPKPPPDPPSEPALPAGVAPSEVRQRWRLAYRRRPDAPSLAPKEITAAWEAGLAASGLPIAGLELPAARPRLVFGAPLPAGLAAERELMDIFLTARSPVSSVRDAIEGALPPGHELVEIHDVWLGAPALSGQVAAADYRIRVRAGSGGPLDLASLETACDRVMQAPTLPRTRDKGGRLVAYDLRPLLAGAAAVAVDPDRRGILRIRTRFDPERGVGRPEEVVAAIADLLGSPLEILDTVRERLLLIGES